MDFEWQDDFLVPVIELDNGDQVNINELIEIEEQRNEGEEYA